MTDTPLKMSELPTSSNVAITDRILVLKDPSGTPSVKTISVNNFINSVSHSVSFISGPYANDSLAESVGNVGVGVMYYDSSGSVKIRLS